MGRRKRGLSDEDRALWHRVAESVTPRLPAPPASETAPPPKPVIAKTPAPPRAGVPPFRVGEAAAASGPAHDLSPGIAERIARAPVSMDRKAFGRLKRGKLQPEARIDLHGMTQAQAHPALTRFIQEAHARGLRLVLVITGKGKAREVPGPMPVPVGVLKHQVPHWLNTGPLRPHVLQIAEAHLKHGGSGAYYVYLRRPR